MAESSCLLLICGCCQSAVARLAVYGAGSNEPAGCGSVAGQAMAVLSLEPVLEVWQSPGTRAKVGKTSELVSLLCGCDLWSVKCAAVSLLGPVCVVVVVMACSNCCRATLLS